MNTKILTVQLESQIQTVALRSAEMLGGVEVDEANGIIRNCAVMTVGPALGYGWDVDPITIQQTQALLSEKPGGVVMRFRHPVLNAGGRPADALGTDVGHLKNPRIVGNSVRGDVHLAEYAKNLPGLGNIWPYLLGKAKSDPTEMGLSAACTLTLEAAAGAQNGRQTARMRAIDKVDFVEKAAANPNGLLSEPNESTLIAASAGDSTSTPKSGVSNMDTNTAAPAAPVSPPEAIVQTAVLATPSAPQAVTAVSTPAPSVSAVNLQAEQERVTQINQLAAIYPDLPKKVVLAAVGGDCSVQQARTMFLQAIADANPVVTGVQSGSITVGHDEGRAAYLAAIPDAIQLRAGGVVDKPHELAVKLRGQRLTDMFKLLLVQLGADYHQVMLLSPIKMATFLTQPMAVAQAYPQIYAQLAQSTDSFSNLLVDAMGKQLRKAYMDTPTTWQMWCARDTTPDFKSKKFIALSDAPGLVLKPEGAEIKYGVFSDSKETATVATYAEGIKLTREAIINDDLNAFSRIPMAQGGAAKRLEDDTAYAILTANATLADTGALFNSTAVTSAGGHANLMATTGSVGAPTVATLAATEKLIRSVTDPAATASGVVNPYYDSYQVIPEPRLDANSAVIWYLAADPGIIDTVTLVFLTDEPEPVLAQETAFDTLDAKFAVRHTLVGKAVDFRGLASNAGA